MLERCSLRPLSTNSLRTTHGCEIPLIHDRGPSLDGAGYAVLGHVLLLGGDFNKQNQR